MVALDGLRHGEQFCDGGLFRVIYEPSAVLVVVEDIRTKERVGLTKAGARSLAIDLLLAADSAND